ncbi:bifunctional dTDP-4-dehydrorhamnose 3,5-epimerase/dTDP-4-dehydrorhamnose reductase isoform X2 [Durio zibethinus]|uniref:Bifunctional dTDP-4-dehydrorhamnose 3,5-epimerase/dTDP-4-dehydrorhamnose reductase isoform X2 n=1 Tax=Durio zibethinus TaxID=66656 RepID=A0A6P5YCM7_DURZI|nr:bifunctional dTDP-4-dehydrorhamnose 3,5-epimerase/dTDP-4-dehydrorhamnose reductase isoform X2 [Durio zibethinus]
MGFPANGSSGKPLKFLIYGRTGWIGGLLGKLCESKGIDFEYGSGRLENRPSLESDMAAVKPTHVFNAAGVTGRPNVDWCESHKVETIRTNVVGTLTLADVCRDKGLVLINYATGCIFEYDAAHPIQSGIGFKEEDTPNFTGSFYSKTKAMICSAAGCSKLQRHMNLKYLIKQPSWLGQSLVQSSHKDQQLGGKQSLLCEGLFGHGHAMALEFQFVESRRSKEDGGVGWQYYQGSVLFYWQAVPGNVEIGSKPRDFHGWSLD